MEQRLKNFASIMVAIVSILGALSFIQNDKITAEASSADSAGLAALQNRQTASILSYITAYEEGRAYASATYYNNLGFSYYDEAEGLKNASDEEAALPFYDKAQAVWGVASELEEQFLNLNYTSQDGSYDTRRVVLENLAAQAEELDINADPHFEKAQVAKDRYDILNLSTTIFAFAFFFYALVGVTQKTWVLVFFNLMGTIASLLGIAGMLFTAISA
jgi:hypothetical protein